MYDKYLRTKALSIVYACVSMLGVMSGVYKVPFWNLTKATVYKDCLGVSSFSTILGGNQCVGNTHAKTMDGTVLYHLRTPCAF